jgi:phosphoglycolate phosphatase-like HAD superfamily hydrolase
MLETVIFDIDGTPLDSVDIHAQTWVDAFKEFGHDIKLTQFAAGSERAAIISSLPGSRPGCPLLHNPARAGPAGSVIGCWQIAGHGLSHRWPLGEDRTASSNGAIEVKRNRRRMTSSHALVCCSA